MKIPARSLQLGTIFANLSHRKTGLKGAGHYF